ncbi:HET domain-containing protein [Aspergillus candidus]|uniref:HET-domain-containing protein n=1 Tax=Aspergillus candidus TaxID=41067 RepID=A0A2I2FND4_ASPCN|nr:HET-domain-containing protein [Aspergillus candidus]PLB42132.1 HET-domain-containing protein [Aspergillus candidus]
MPNSDPSSPTAYVCDRCWQGFFNTEAYEKCFTLHHIDANYNQNRTEALATVHEINNTVCNWCAYIRNFIRDKWAPEDLITTSFSPSTISSCTPTGSNIFYLNISCHSPLGKWKGAQDPASDYVTARPLRTDINSDEAKVQIREWLRDCKEHTCCRTLHKNPSLPTRVIEVSPPGRQYARVLESKNLRGLYATLSYCWGKESFLRLDEETLPPTIRDALATARTLSIPYLWVDALCIIQDSEEDKAKETARMKEVYASSVLTIVAASAENVSAGFLYPRVHREIVHTIPVRLQPDAFGTMCINELDAVCYDERLEPISKRGWAMQEQLLSSSVLIFTSRTIMWRCRGGIKNFGDSLYFPHDLDAGYNTHDEKYSLNLHTLLLSREEACAHKDQALSCWLRLVTAYSIRVTSLERDRLNALAGLASHPSFCHALGPSYFAGLWQYNIARQLLWRTSTWHRSLAEDESFTIEKPAIYQAPSWSWASLKGGMVYFDFSYGEEETTPRVICEILDCSTTPTFPELNPFGEILSAQLRLRAPARKAWFKPSTSNVFVLSDYACDQPKGMAPKDEKVSLVEAFQIHVKDFRLRYPDVNTTEEPEAVYGTDPRNMCGTCDETEFHEYYLVLCVAINVDDQRNDAVQGLLLIEEEDERKTLVNISVVVAPAVVRMAPDSRDGSRIEKCIGFRSSSFENSPNVH